MSEPVVTIAVEPKHPKDLPKLVEALRRITVEDPNLVVKINEESGETLMAGMGVLHLEIATSLLQEAGLVVHVKVKAPPVLCRAKRDSVALQADFPLFLDFRLGVNVDKLVKVRNDV